MNKLPSRTKVVGYVRVSTECQADEGVSLAAQRTKIEQYAALYDLEVVAIHVDGGVSAKSLDRPGVQAALADLDAGKADGLLVAKLDRLTRSVSDLGTLIDRYFGKRFTLFSVADSIDTRSASGRMVLNILASIGQWEREAAGERTRDALAHLKAKGVHVGSVGLGWTRGDEVDADGRRVVRVAKEEQATVGRIVELRSQGLTLRGVAAMLTNEGRLTKRGGRWQAQTVRAVLQRCQSERHEMVEVA